MLNLSHIIRCIIKRYYEIMLTFHEYLSSYNSKQESYTCSLNVLIQVYIFIVIKYLTSFDWWIGFVDFDLSNFSFESRHWSDNS